MSQGYSESIRDTQEIHAGLIASLMNVTQQLKRPKRFTVAKLIGRRKSETSFHVERGEDISKIKDRITDLRERNKDDTVW